MIRISTILGLLTLAVLTLENCSSGKGALQRGNYYDAVITSSNRLCRNDTHKKSIETLREGYPLSVSYYEGLIISGKASTVAFKWRGVVQSYTYLQRMHNEIRRCPGALKVIPSPKDYSSQLADANRNAAEESYVAGLTALATGTREKAKEAHGLFIQTNEYVAGYKDVISKIEEALWAATLKVVVEPIPRQARNQDANIEYLENKISEYLHADNGKKYVRFFTPDEARAKNLQADHIVKLGFDEFAVGQVYLKETQIPVERDSVAVGPVGAVEGVGNLRSTTPRSGVPVIIATPTKQDPVEKSQPAEPVKAPTVEPVKSEPPVTATPQPPKEPAPEPKTQTAPTPTPTKPPTAPNPEPEPATSSPKSPEPKPTPEIVPPATPPSTSSPSPTENNNEKTVTICHIPPGNPGNSKTMTIPQSALKAHLGHGDSEGTCPPMADKEKKNHENEKATKDTKEQGNEKLKNEKAEKGNNESKNENLEEENKEKSKVEEKDNTNKEKNNVDKEKADKEKEKKKNNLTSHTESFAYQTRIDPLRLFASSSSTLFVSNIPISLPDTTVISTFKATVSHFNKTVTSSGIMDLQIMDAKTGRVIMQEKIPAEYIWKSEWATFNGDERALSDEYVKLSQQKEQQPPSSQELFKLFTTPMLDQIKEKLSAFYKNY